MSGAAAQLLRHPALRPALSAVLALAVVSHLSLVDWQPPGPDAVDPGYGAGSDWDARLYVAWVGEAARARGAFPHWDPYADFGAPLFANPESFLLHPAYALGTRLGGPRLGIGALYGFSILVLLLGLEALAARLKLPLGVGILSSIGILTSAEWEGRLQAGHLFVLGFCHWPLALAMADRALEGFEPGPPSQASPAQLPRALLRGAGAGAVLGLSLVGGSHYGPPAGLLMVGLLLWARGAPAVPALLLAAVPWLAIPLGEPHPMLRAVLVSAGLAAILWGLLRSPLRRAQLAAWAGVGLGLLASAGFWGVPALAMQLGQTQFSAAVNRFTPLDLGLNAFLHPSSSGYGMLLPMPNAAFWAAGLGGLAAWLGLRRALGVALVFALGYGWTQGRPLQPHELVRFAPGFHALQQVSRLQWVVPLLAPLGLAAGAGSLAAFAVPRLRGAVALLVALALALGLHLYPPSEREHRRPAPPGSIDPAALGRVDGWDPHGAFFSRAALRGRAIAWPEQFRFRPREVPGVAGSAMAWLTGEAGEADAVAAGPQPLPPGALSLGSVDGWRLQAPAGSLISIAQRDIRGWRCAGGTLLPEPGAPGGPGDRWLTLRIGESGRASCRWVTPGLALGILAQGAALLLLLAIALGARRGRRRASGASGAPGASRPSPAPAGRLPCLLLPALALLLPACPRAAPGDDGAAASEEPPDPRVAPPDHSGIHSIFQSFTSNGPASASDAGPCQFDPPDAPVQVEFRESPGARWWDCDFDARADEPGCTCVGDYLELRDRAERYVLAPVRRSEILDEFDAMELALDGQPGAKIEILEEPLPPEDLAQALVRAQGMCFLREGAAARPLLAEIAAREDGGTFDMQRLVLSDPYVGRFEAVLLLPKGAGPFPAAVVMPGHGDSADDWVADYHGGWYPWSGFALLVLTQRALCADSVEHRTAFRMLRLGWSMLGIRSYEALLGRKVLRALPSVDGERIALIGHSSGSIAANVTIRTRAGFRALVTDRTDTYFAYFHRPEIADVMSPGVFPFFRLINDFGTSEVPVLQAGYGYGVLNESDPRQPNELPAIFEFLDEAMGG